MPYGSYVYGSGTYKGIGNLSATSIAPTIHVYARLLQPTVYVSRDFTITIVGHPRAGTSPLEVDFTATVTFSKEMKNKYRVSLYTWCFNWDAVNSVPLEDYISTTSSSISHVYLGYRGQKYSVKCAVSLELI